MYLFLQLCCSAVSVLKKAMGIAAGNMLGSGTIMVLVPCTF